MILFPVGESLRSSAWMLDIQQLSSKSAEDSSFHTNRRIVHHRRSRDALPVLGGVRCAHSRMLWKDLKEQRYPSKRRVQGEQCPFWIRVDGTK